MTAQARIITLEKENLPEYNNNFFPNNYVKKNYFP
jgi:hypothetical protein